MKQKVQIFAVTLSIFTLLLLPALANADFIKCGGPVTYPPSATPAERAQIAKNNECKLGDLFITVRTIINFLLSWAWLVAIIFIVWSGWNMIIAGGNEEALSTAKTGLSNAIIGFFLIMVAFVLLNFVVSILTGNSIPRPESIGEVFKLIP